MDGPILTFTFTTLQANRVSRFVTLLRPVQTSRQTPRGQTRPDPPLPRTRTGCPHHRGPAHALRPGHRTNPRRRATTRTGPTPKTRARIDRDYLPTPPRGYAHPFPRPCAHHPLPRQEIVDRTWQAPSPRASSGRGAHGWESAPASARWYQPSRRVPPPPTGRGHGLQGAVQCAAPADTGLPGRGVRQPKARETDRSIGRTNMTLKPIRPSLKSAIVESAVIRPQRRSKR